MSRLTSLMMILLLALSCIGCVTPAPEITEARNVLDQTQKDIRRLEKPTAKQWLELGEAQYALWGKLAGKAKYGIRSERPHYRRQAEHLANRLFETVRMVYRRTSDLELEGRVDLFRLRMAEAGYLVGTKRMEVLLSHMASAYPPEKDPKSLRELNGTSCYCLEKRARAARLKGDRSGAVAHYLRAINAADPSRFGPSRSAALRRAVDVRAQGLTDVLLRYEPRLLVPPKELNIVSGQMSGGRVVKLDPSKQYERSSFLQEKIQNYRDRTATRIRLTLEYNGPYEIKVHYEVVFDGYQKEISQWKEFIKKYPNGRTGLIDEFRHVKPFYSLVFHAMSLPGMQHGSGPYYWDPTPAGEYPKSYSSQRLEFDKNGKASGAFSLPWTMAQKLRPEFGIYLVARLMGGPSGKGGLGPIATPMGTAPLFIKRNLNP